MRLSTAAIDMASGQLSLCGERARACGCSSSSLHLPFAAHAASSASSSARGPTCPLPVTELAAPPRHRACTACADLRHRCARLLPL
eukprot:4746060-Prymnesium_polylepis.1